MSKMDENGWAIVASGLTKHYGELVAVDGVSLKVPRGEIVGFLQAWIKKNTERR